jgi:hypothetical protein
VVITEPQLSDVASRTEASTATVAGSATAARNVAAPTRKIEELMTTPRSSVVSLIDLTVSFLRHLDQFKN